MGLFNNVAEAASDIEQEIRAIVRTEPPERLAIDYAPPAVRKAAQADAGRLSAAVMTQEYQTAAAAIEAMGEELKVTVQQCENMAHEAMTVISELTATASHYRAEGKRLAEMVERCTALVADVRKTCTELQAKIATTVV